eukprot:scaffold2858_cov659-Pavlova_lutheri.AAC.115
MGSAYIRKRDALDTQLALLYTEYISHKLKLGGYMRRRITEARLQAPFEKLFGGPEVTIITIGEFEQHKHRNACDGECKTFRGNENPDRIKAALSSHTDPSSGQERRLKHLEGSGKRDSWRSTSGLSLTSQRLNQGCYTGITQPRFRRGWKR